MWDIALVAAFTGLMTGVVTIWAKIHNALGPVVVWSFVGSIFGLALYSLFSASLNHATPFGWQGLSWMFVGSLFALTAFTVWREIKS